MSERQISVRRRFEVFEMHMVIYALVEASTENEALSIGKAVFERLVGADLEGSEDLWIVPADVHF